MREALKLNIDGIEMIMQIKNYIKPNDEDEYSDNWTKTNFSLKSGNWLKYNFDREVLLSSDIDYLVDMLEKSLNYEFKEAVTVSFPEPDFSFELYPVLDLRTCDNILYVREGCELQDIFSEFEIHFWDSGILTGNKLCLTLSKDIMEIFVLYLKLISGKMKIDDEQIQNLVKEDIILSC